MDIIVNGNVYRDWSDLEAARAETARGFELEADRLIIEATGGLSSAHDVMVARVWSRRRGGACRMRERVACAG